MYELLMTGSFLIECMVGFYGDKCNSSCGHCLNNTACHHITGVCNQQCEPGYQAPNCTEGIILLKTCNKQYIFCSKIGVLKMNFQKNHCDGW